MVISKLDNTIDYEDTFKIENADKSTNKEIYEIPIFSYDCLITVGNPINKNNNIIYFPIYLIKYNLKIIQIGIYEINKTKVTLKDINNSDHFFDLIYDTEPLLYSFVNKNFIEEMHITPKEYDMNIKENKNDESSEENMKQINTNINSIFHKIEKNNIPIKLTEETKENNLNYIHNFESSRNNNNYWVQKFMKNIHYNYEENEGQGDCFFYAIKQAYNSIGLNVNISDLRQVLSEQIKQSNYDEYRALYDENINQQQQIEQNINNLMLEQNIINDKNDKNKDKESIKNLLNYINNKKYNNISKEEQTEILNKIKDLKNEKDLLNKINQYKFMKNINSLHQLKDFIKTNNYWADEWSIITLELLLNVKFIILRQDSYNDNDILNVLQCQNGPNDESIDISKNFNPKYYIILDYDGNYYQLITYKSAKIFTFGELPFGLKEIIVNNCLKNNNGIYSYIKDFINFKNNEFIPTNQNGGKHNKNQEECDGQIMEELYQFGPTKLWDDNIKFIFYDKSSNSIPGKGQGEKIPKHELLSFAKLNKIKDWRRKLDNSWIQPFTLDEKIWASVYHYVEACKFKSFPKIYEKIALDSNSPISKKINKLKQFVTNNIDKIDENYNDKTYCMDMYLAQEAKFMQNDDLKKILLNTKKANLYQQRKGKKAIQCTNLMLIRKKLNINE